MKLFKGLILSGAATVALLSANSAQAADLAVQNTVAKMKVMSDAEVLALDPVANPLKPPSTAQMKADIGAGSNAKVCANPLKKQKILYEENFVE